MVTEQSKINNLEQEILYLRQEISRLRMILDYHGINYIQQSPKNNYIKNVSTQDITREHALLLYSVFKGRKDVYSKRCNLKNGGSAYYTQCDNFWQPGICPKASGAKIKCFECSNRKWTPLRQRVLIDHLNGEKNDGSDVIGIYPLLLDDTCNFLVFDFDNHDNNTSEMNDGANIDNYWMEEVDTLRTICVSQGIHPLVERSRSGKGAHVWIFFSEAIPASLARRFGSALLTKGAETINLKNFKSYDRMLPAQDKMPKGGLGNLIALPLQGLALQKGNSAFIDEKWQVYSDQWSLLKNVMRLSKEYIEEKINEWNLDPEPTNIFSNEDNFFPSNELEPEIVKPWKKPKLTISSDNINGKMNITVANQVYVETANLHPSVQNTLRRMGAFSNRLFYKKQAAGFNVRGIPRIIWCGCEENGFISIPRGRLETLLKTLKDEGILYTLVDKRNEGKRINVDFCGKLYPEQQEAVDAMLKYEIGILSAATAFGKTAVGAALISEKKVNTLILVHNREIMKNWEEDLNKFLLINEEPLMHITKGGKSKRYRNVIGKMYAGHDSIEGIIDIAMISSLGKDDDTDDRLSLYGMVIMDECHHAGAANAENVLKNVFAKYVYGLTATPKRDDGMEQKMFMQFGPIRWKFTSKDKIRQQGFICSVLPRFTSLINVGKIWNVHQAFNEVVHCEQRNQQIIDDVRLCIKEGKSPLLLTRFREHAALLQDLLHDCADHVFLLQGGRSAKERDSIRTALNKVASNETVLLIAIGQYIGEGFNFPRLDTLILTMPIAWEGNVEQYAGRLLRTYEGKHNITIIDYIDSHVPILDKMFRKRLKAYKKIGYTMSEHTRNSPDNTQGIFDCNEIRQRFELDVKAAEKEIIIASPGINKERITWLCNTMTYLLQKNIDVLVYTMNPEHCIDNIRSKTEELIQIMKKSGISINCESEIHEHFAVIDRKIIWYGSANLLSCSKEDDNMLRLFDEETATKIISFAKDKQTIT